jgi:hypothetical protein
LALKRLDFGLIEIDLHDRLGKALRLVNFEGFSARLPRNDILKASALLLLDGDDSGSWSSV